MPGPRRRGRCSLSTTPRAATAHFRPASTCEAWARTPRSFSSTVAASRGPGPAASSPISPPFQAQRSSGWTSCSTAPRPCMVRTPSAAWSTSSCAAASTVRKPGCARRRRRAEPRISPCLTWRARAGRRGRRWRALSIRTPAPSTRETAPTRPRAICAPGAASTIAESTVRPAISRASTRALEPMCRPSRSVPARMASPEPPLTLRRDRPISPIGARASISYRTRSVRRPMRDFARRWATGSRSREI